MIELADDREEAIEAELPVLRVEREVNEVRSSAHVGQRSEAVEATVHRLIAIVAQPQEMLRGHEQRAPIVVRWRRGSWSEAGALHLEAVLPRIVRRGIILRERIGDRAEPLPLLDAVHVEHSLA